MGHTPGPWQVGGCRYGWLKSEIATLNYSRVVATVWTKQYKGRDLVDWEEGNANAQLIAAAPELLEACKWALVEFERHSPLTCDGCKQTRFMLKEALTKAE